MSVRRLLPSFLFTLFLFSQTEVFLPNVAFGWMCCNCSICKWTPSCVCPGTPGYCGGFACISFSTDKENPLKSIPIGNGKVDIQRLTHLTKVTECTRLSFSLRVLGDAGQDLQIETFTVGTSSFEEKTATPKLTANSGM